MPRSEVTPSQFIPEVFELQSAPAASDVFLALSDLPHCLFLDSAQRHPELGRYSYVTADPFDYREWSLATPDPLGRLHAAMEPWTSVEMKELPVFQGGAAGLLAYDLGRSLETIPLPYFDEFQFPALAIGLYDVVVAFDHLTEQAWLISQGWPERTQTTRRLRARRRLADFQSHLQERLGTKAGDQSRREPQISSRKILGPNHIVGRGAVHSNFTAETYRKSVARAIEYIRAGDIFQVNLAQRLLHPANRHSTELYMNLRRENPAPFAGYFDLGDAQVISASPERFLRVAQRTVETRPIKGTRPRRRGDEADLYAGDDLRASEKDRAENIMIVDLMRNDLSRVCDVDSVKVTQYCEIETYQFVQHLVSAVRGELAADRTVIDLVRASFPGGSITGAPKIRAMQIIAEIEPHARGAYCGSLGFLSSGGAMDLSILIRTITASGGWWQFPVGGGIVAQSDPAREYDETWHKAEGLLRGILA